MGVDVYTPAYRRMLETDAYRQWRIRHDDWLSRQSVQANAETKEDWVEFDEIIKIEDRLESAVGHFRHRQLFESQIEPIMAFEAGENCGFTLTADQVAQYVAEWRGYLRIEVAQNRHLEQWENGFHEPVPSPFARAVRFFKGWCVVHRLGEGCYVL